MQSSIGPGNLSSTLSLLHFEGGVRLLSPISPGSFFVGSLLGSVVGVGVDGDLLGLAVLAPKLALEQAAASATPAVRTKVAARSGLTARPQGIDGFGGPVNRSQSGYAPPDLTPYRHYLYFSLGRI